MNFVGTNIVTGKDEIFEIDDVEKCEIKLDFIKSGRGQNISMSQGHVFLKSGKEFIVRNSVYDAIKDVMEKIER